MEENKIELTKEQLITLLGGQLHKCSCVTEYADLINVERKGLVWSGSGIGVKDGVVCILKTHKDVDTHLLMKFWGNKEDISRKDLSRDNSEKVQNILIPYENTKFYIVYVSYIGLKLVIDNIMGKEKGSKRVTHRFTFIIEHI